MSVIELKNCAYAPWGQGIGLAPFSFSLGLGEVAGVVADRNEDAHLFLRALATLELPLEGEIFSHGNRLDTGDYRRVLAWKRKVGYIASDAAVFSNRTLGETLLYSSRYFGEADAAEIDPATMAMCEHFEIAPKLDLRPAHAYEEDVRLTILVRELAKNPDILIMERPSMHLDHPSHMQVLDKLRELAGQGLPMVLYTFNQNLLDELATKTVRIINGALSVDYKSPRAR